MSAYVIERVDGHLRAVCPTFELARERIGIWYWGMAEEHGYPKHMYDELLDELGRELNSGTCGIHSLQLFANSLRSRLQMDATKLGVTPMEALPILHVRDRRHREGTLTFPNGSREHWRNGRLAEIEIDNEQVWTGDAEIRCNLIGAESMRVCTEELSNARGGVATELQKRTLCFDPSLGWELASIA